MTDAARRMRCHFCSKDEDDVELLIAGQFGNICNDCVALAAQIVVASRREKKQ